MRQTQHHFVGIPNVVDSPVSFSWPDWWMVDSSSRYRALTGGLAVAFWSVLVDFASRF